MENKTISDLNNKTWYRFLKVFFVLSFLCALMIYNVFFVFIKSNQISSNYIPLSINPSTGGNCGIFCQAYYEQKQKNTENKVKNIKEVERIIIGNVIILFIFEGIRRSFYYVVLGTIKPKK